MLEAPRVVDLIHKSCVLTHVIATDLGIPDLPALEPFQKDFATNPWAHMNYAHFLIITPDGRELLVGSGTSFKEAPYHMSVYEPDRAIALLTSAKLRHERFRERENPEKAESLAALRREIRSEIEEAYPPLQDVRLFAARVLLGRGPDLTELRSLLKPPAKGEKDQLEAGIRPMVFESLGQFLTDDRPFLASAASDVQAVYGCIDPGEAHSIVEGIMKRKGKRRVEISDLPIPPSLRRRAAGIMLEMSEVKVKDGDVIAQAIELWRERRQEGGAKIKLKH